MMFSKMESIKAGLVTIVGEIEIGADGTVASCTVLGGGVTCTRVALGDYKLSLSRKFKGGACSLSSSEKVLSVLCDSVDPDDVAEPVLNFQTRKRTASFWIGPGEFNLVDGTRLAKYAADGSATPGTNVLGGEMNAITWDNRADHTYVIAGVPFPSDCDPTKDMTIELLTTKDGATDTPIFTIGLYNQESGVEYDADVSYGGDTSAMAVTTKILQKLRRTMPSASLPSLNSIASGAMLTVLIKPKDGTAPNDPVSFGGVRILYTPTDALVDPASGTRIQFTACLDKGV